jgi:hypothetical protein
VLEAPLAYSNKKELLMEKQVYIPNKQSINQKQLQKYEIIAENRAEKSWA